MTVQALSFRNRVFSFENACSIGFRSGLYGGRKIKEALAARIAARTARPLWLPRLSIDVAQEAAAVDRTLEHARTSDPVTSSRITPMWRKRWITC